MALTMVHTNFLLYIILFFLSHFTSAQNNNANGNITVGSSLTATGNSNSSSWLSPSGDFALGFKQHQDNNNLFLPSIWFDKIPNKTVVWYPRGISPVPRGSTLRLDASQGLVLRDPRGGLLWNNATATADDQVAYGFMNDTGNFILLRRDATVLWESFRHPADTILPTQTLEIGEMLVSRKMETNFSIGRFYALIDDHGDLVFNTRQVPSNTDFDATYFRSGTSNVKASNAGYQLLFNETGSISVRLRNGQQVVLTPSASSSDYYHRATLEFDGVFTQYYHPRNVTGNVSGWTTAWSWPRNICLNFNGYKGTGACGYNNVCTLNGNQKPVCACPQGYSLVDPNDAYGDCKPKFVQTCGDEGNGSTRVLFHFIEISNTDWPHMDYEIIDPSTEQNCRSACLNDCLCAAAIYRANSCWKKKLPLSYGRVNPALGSTAFLKIGLGDASQPNLNPDTPKRNQKNLILMGSVLLGSSAFINFLLITAVCLGFFLIYKKRIPNLRQVHNTVESNLRCFTYKELVQATDDFKDELGRGAFGIVYKGLVPYGSNTAVAVKKLDKVAHDSEKEFRTEVFVIGHTHHKNLVRLVGFCDEGLERLLVYEYMSNGTLADFLFIEPKPSWTLRTGIALGVARGLTYLHEECNTQIIHCDIKPQNVLLDEFYNARISDFGLAKLLMMDQSQTQTNIRGTKGYVAPEWFRNTQITAKVDVYSFGVLLLEIITCRKSVGDVEGEYPILTDWVWDCFQEGRLDTLVGNDVEALNDGKTLEMFVMVGIWCIQEDASLRPTMRRASQMLEGTVEVAVPPCPFRFPSTA